MRTPEKNDASRSVRYFSCSQLPSTFPVVSDLSTFFTVCSTLIRKSCTPFQYSLPGLSGSLVGLCDSRYFFDVFVLLYAATVAYFHLNLCFFTLYCIPCFCRIQLFWHDERSVIPLQFHRNSSVAHFVRFRPTRPHSLRHPYF